MTTMQTNPARVLAVATLLIDVLEDLRKTDDVNKLSQSELEMLVLLARQLTVLRSIRDKARAEMSQLAPAVRAV